MEAYLPLQTMASKYNLDQPFDAFKCKNQQLGRDDPEEN